MSIYVQLFRPHRVPILWKLHQNETTDIKTNIELQYFQPVFQRQIIMALTRILRKGLAFKNQNIILFVMTFSASFTVKNHFSDNFQIHQVFKSHRNFFVDSVYFKLKIYFLVSCLLNQLSWFVRVRKLFILEIHWWLNLESWNSQHC